MTGMGAEARRIAVANVEEIKSLSWTDLDAYGVRTEVVVSPAGCVFRVKSMTYWDMEDWASEMLISVKVYCPSGWRRYWPYSAGGGRGDPDDPIPERPADQ